MAKFKYYDLIDSETKETVRSPLCSESELEEFLNANPNLTFAEGKMSDLGSPGLHSGRPMSVYKTDGAFKEKLDGLKRFYPRNTINT